MPPPRGATSPGNTRAPFPRDPFTGTRSPVTDTLPLVTKTRSPVTETFPPATETHSPVTETLPLVTET